MIIYILSLFILIFITYIISDIISLIPLIIFLWLFLVIFLLTFLFIYFCSFLNYLFPSVVFEGNDVFYIFDRDYNGKNTFDCSLSCNMYIIVIKRVKVYSCFYLMFEIPKTVFLDYRIKMLLSILHSALKIRNSLSQACISTFVTWISVSTVRMKRELEK